MCNKLSLCTEQRIVKSNGQKNNTMDVMQTWPQRLLKIVVSTNSPESFNFIVCEKSMQLQIIEQERIVHQTLP